METIPEELLQPLDGSDILPAPAGEPKPEEEKKDQQSIDKQQQQEAVNISDIMKSNSSFNSQTQNVEGTPKNQKNKEKPQIKKPSFDSFVGSDLDDESEGFDLVQKLALDGSKVSESLESSRAEEDQAEDELKKLVNKRQMDPVLGFRRMKAIHKPKRKVSAKRNSSKRLQRSMSTEIKDDDSEDKKAKKDAIKSQRPERKFQNSKVFKRQTKTEVIEKNVEESKTPKLF